MVTVNENYLLLKSSYIFSEINRRVEEFQRKNPGADIIRMGIGDVTRPLPRQLLRPSTGPLMRWQRRRHSGVTDRNRDTPSSGRP
jgi:LL-diaminopimelate aminotransferase apoenzyme (EC 2.6.1.83)